MYCKKCGESVQENWKYCPRCQSNLQNGNVETNKEVIIQLEQKANKNSQICLLIFFVSIICFIFINNYRGIFFLISLISIVNGYIKYPNNKLIKILFWIFIIIVAIYFLFILLIMYTCFSIWDISGIG